MHGAVRHQLDEDLGRQVAEEVEAVRSAGLAEEPQPLRDLIRAGIDVGPEDERLHADDATASIVALICASPCAVLGRDRVLHHQHEGPFGIDLRAGAAEGRERVPCEPKLGLRRRRRSRDSRR